MKDALSYNCAQEQHTTRVEAPILSNTIQNVKEINKMNKADFNVVDNNDTQELAKGIAFLKSRRAVANLSLMLDEMNAKTIPNGVDIRFAYCDLWLFAGRASLSGYGIL